MGVTNNCVICEENSAKYKCPKCLIKYCSVGCFKTHKESCQSKEIEEKEKSHSSEAKVESHQKPVSADDEETESEDRVPIETLAKLGSSEALKELLQNRHLRTILTGIDSSDTKDIALQAAMQEPIFTEFVDECLDTVDPISRTEKATVS